MTGATTLVFVSPGPGNNLPSIPLALFPCDLLFPLRLLRFTAIQGTCDTRSVAREFEKPRGRARLLPSLRACQRAADQAAGDDGGVAQQELRPPKW